MVSRRRGGGKRHVAQARGMQWLVINGEIASLPHWIENFPYVQGVSIGSCITDAIPEGVHGHTHVREAVMCLRAADWDNSHPSTTFLHEYAHIVDGVVDHSYRWALRYLTLTDDWHTSADVYEEAIADIYWSMDVADERFLELFYQSSDADVADNFVEVIDDFVETLFTREEWLELMSV